MRNVCRKRLDGATGVRCKARRQLRMINVRHSDILAAVTLNFILSELTGDACRFCDGLSVLSHFG